MAIVTKTLRAAGGNYTLASMWNSGEATDLVTAGDQHVLKCYDDWPTGLLDTLNVSGWTTDGTRNVTIEAADGEGWDGDKSKGFWIRRATNFQACITISQEYTTLRNVRVTNPNNGGSGITTAAGCDGSTIERCYAAGGEAGTNTSGAGIKLNSITNGQPVHVRNNLTYQARNGIYVVSPTTGAYIEANTCIESELAGIYDAVNNVETAFEINNNASYGSTTDFNSVGSNTPTATNNSSQDLTAPGTNPQLSLSTLDFNDYAGGDFSPAASGKLDGNGADLSARFTDDITGTTRTQWDIGAYLLAGTPPVGLKEMYVKSGGVFTQAAPHVRDGGAWKAADAYVRDGGAWVKVHDK